MKLLILVMMTLSLNVMAQYQSPQPPPPELKTPNEKVMDEHHQPGGALKVKKEPAKIEGLNSTPAEKAATEKKLKKKK